MAEPSGPPSPTATISPGTGQVFNFKQAISQMVQRSGSDLLLKVGRAPTVRLNGELSALDMQPLKPARAAVAPISEKNSRRVIAGGCSADSGNSCFAQT